MCELMAICSNVITTPRFNFKEIFPGENPDGWGIGFYVDGKAEILKEPLPAYESDLARKIEDGRIKVSSRIIIAHVRDASVGSRKIDNTHPFRIKLLTSEWLFAHNGTVGKRTPPTGIFLEQTGKFEPEGETDSERAFCYIMNRIDEREKSRISRIRDTVKEYADYIKGFGNFNFVMSDSEHLYCYGDDSLWFRDGDYGIKSDVKRDGEKAIAVATRPLNDNKWKRIKGLRIFRRGTELF